MRISSPDPWPSPDGMPSAGGVLWARPGFALSGKSPVRALMMGFAAATLVLGAISIGYLIAIGQTTVVAAVLIATGSVLLAVFAPGPFLALMLLVTLNGIPGVDLGGKLGPVRTQDYAVIALIVVLHARRGKPANSYGAHLAGLAGLWAACLIAWWLLTVARSALSDGVPVFKAALFGRDFLYFAILVPVALRARIPGRSLRAGAVLLGGGVAAYAVGQVIVSLSGAHLPWLVHSYQSAEVSGFTRVYAEMGDVLSVSLMFVVALLFSRQASGKRIPLVGLATLFLLAVALGFTRADYLALVIALAVAVIVHTMRRGSLTAVTFRVAMFVLAVILIAVSMTVIGAGNDGITTAVSSRLEAGIQNVTHSTGTVGYRHQLDEKMLAVLHEDWPVGLGFLHPDAHYVWGLPEGSIRNSDTGVFNVLMTMGVVGMLLLYAPLFFAFQELVRLNGSLRPFGRDRPMWLVYGGTAWVTWVLAGSVTLVVLFSVTGLVVTALVLAVLGQAGLQGESGLQ